MDEFELLDAMNETVDWSKNENIIGGIRFVLKLI